ncbi:MAG: hypothetical protein KTR31_19080 [Myxococcales bacterium]|nr:hypothetical protein [Myxococcales bacterium]
MLLTMVAWMTGVVAQADDKRAQRLVRQAQKAHGMHRLRDVQITFTFRDTPYRLWLGDGAYRYERDVTQDDGALRVDRLEGWTLTSILDGQPLSLPAETTEGRRRSLNSVAYFALLPRPLTDDAVVATYGGRQQLRESPYDVLDVRFREDGGGDDHDDHFRYWLDPKSHRIAYLAYTFSRGEGGVRIREATATHEVGGLVLLDYVNHGRNVTQDLRAAVAEFEAGTLPEVSRIELDDVSVSRGVSAP